VPSLVVAKTSLVVAQALLTAVGLLIVWITGVGGSMLLLVMGALLGVEVIGVGGLLVVQLAEILKARGVRAAFPHVGFRTMFVSLRSPCLDGEMLAIADRRLDNGLRVSADRIGGLGKTARTSAFRAREFRHREAAARTSGRLHAARRNRTPRPSPTRSTCTK
jgi:hypothetical protein